MPEGVATEVKAHRRCFGKRRPVIVVTITSRSRGESNNPRVAGFQERLGLLLLLHCTPGCTDTNFRNVCCTHLNLLACRKSLIPAITYRVVALVVPAARLLWPGNRNDIVDFSTISFRRRIAYYCGCRKFSLRYRRYASNVKLAACYLGSIMVSGCPSV